MRGRLNLTFAYIPCRVVFGKRNIFFITYSTRAYTKIYDVARGQNIFFSVNNSLNVRENLHKGIIKKIWKNIKYILAIGGDSFFHYTEKTRGYAGDIPYILCQTENSLRGCVNKKMQGNIARVAARSAFRADKGVL